MEKTTIINGNHTLAVASDHGISRSLEPVPVIREISINNIKAGQIYVFYLSEQLTEDYEILTITGDLLDDDDTPLDTPISRPNVFRGTIDLMEFSSDRLLRYMSFQAQALYKSISGMYLRQDRIWKLTANEDINTLTLICRPVIFEPEIKFIAIEEVKKDDQ